jgi:hypothetical protein
VREAGKAYSIFIGKPNMKWLFGSLRKKDGIKMCLKEIDFEDMKVRAFYRTRYCVNKAHIWSLC